MTQTVPTPTRAVQQRYRDPEPVEPAQWNPVLQVLHEHRSVLRYLAEPVPDATLRLLISGTQSAPTSSHSWTERALTRLASAANVNGRYRLRESLTNHGFRLR
ncbi:hypothetical protein AB4305_08040 [Nocardia sp. 2YAB30]|uniref:hypothetical protein n=1 Tax=unclassified Nocardia TaxID=2637762 RepID=UPI003F9A6CF6